MKKITVLLAIVLTYTTTSYGYLVSDYEWYSYNGHQYTLTMEHSNWVDAEAEAITVGGHLVTINDVDEQNWLLDTASNPFGDQYNRDFQGIPNGNAAWIGLEYIGGDKDSPSSWEWQNGEPITFWNPDSADLYSGLYMYMLGTYHPNGSGEWDCHSDNYTAPSQYLRGVIEVVPEPCSLILICGGCLFLRGKRK